MGSLPHLDGVGGGVVEDAGTRSLGHRELFLEVCDGRPGDLDGWVERPKPGGVVPQDATTRTEEDELVASFALDRLAEDLGEERGEWNLACLVALRRPPLKLPADVDDVLDDRQPPASEVDAAHLEGRELAPPESGVGQDEHQRPIGTGGVCEAVHLGVREVDLLLRDAAGERNPLCWVPGVVVHVPHGVGFLPFEVPGSKRLEAASVAGLRESAIVVWAKHGVLARSIEGPLGAVDVIEFIETGTRFQVTALQIGDTVGGLTDDEITTIIDAFGIKSAVY